MADDGLEDVRYEHHLRHRGRLNKSLARLFWLVICALLAVCAAQRVFTWWRRRRSSKYSNSLRTHPQLMRIVACFRAVFLLPVPFGLLGISIGRLFALSAYSNTIAGLLLSVHAPKLTPHFVDDVAFRAGWITVTQVPLVYLLATKRGPLQLLTGLSYERINWLHRWVGRILFICATTHMGIMMSSISITDLISGHDQGMSVVRYGMGAYAMLLWIVVSSILPLRKWSYRFFYMNHWACAVMFLIIIANHVPAYARAPIWISFGLIAIDKCMAAYRLMWHNITTRTVKGKVSKLDKLNSRQVLAMGHPVKMMPPVIKNSVSSSIVEQTTVIRLCDVPFCWKPGQHVRLYLPKLGRLEVHPFTPATCSNVSLTPFETTGGDAEFNGLLNYDTEPPANEMVLMIKAHSGITKRLSEYHSEWLSTPCPNASKESSSLTAYIDGPYGSPPSWENYETIVLFATSTGVSFILSILDYLEQLCFDGQVHLHTKEIHFIWTNRHVEPQFENVVTELLLKHSTLLREADIKLHVEFHTTCPQTQIVTQTLEMQEMDPFAHLRQPRRKYFANRRPLRIRNPDNPDDWEADSDADEVDLKEIDPRISETESRSSCETYVSSTLLDENDDRQELFSELESMAGELETSWVDQWRSIGSPKIPQSWKSFINRRWRGTREPQKHKHNQECSCALLRRQELKEKPKKIPDFITKSYGSRPDVTGVLTQAIPRSSEGRSMVAVCSNKGVVMKAKRSVAVMNWEVGRRAREGSVDIWTEGF